MNKNRMPRAIPTLLMAALLSCIVLGAMVSFGGTALAANTPTITKIIQKDTNDKTITMTTGYEAFRVAADPQGNVYVTDPVFQIIYKYNLSGYLASSFTSVRRPLGIAVDNSGNIYVGGNQGGYKTVFVLDGRGVSHGVLGGATAGFTLPNDVAIGGQGGVFVADSDSNTVKAFKDGALTDTYGPYKETYNSELINGTNYTYVRHRLLFPNGIAVDSAKGEIYVTFREYVDQLKNVACSDGNCAYDDTAWLSYTGATSNHKYWYSAADRYIVAVINQSTGAVARKVLVSNFESSGSQTASGITLGGVALDNAGRLYVATNVAGIKIFDASSGAAVAVPVIFSSGTYNDLAFDPATNRLFAAKRDATNSFGVVDIYGIDTYTTPANTAPSAPVLVEPASGTYATSLRPILKIANASDNEADLLVYGYEIKDKDGVIVASASGISEGANGTTSMSVNTALMENASYGWRAQSFDGNSSAWSGESKFCVNERNDNPTTPTVVSPTDMAPSSPFSTSLTWNPSTDPDCYDTVTYTVEVSGDQGFSKILASAAGLGSQSVSLGALKGFESLMNGNAYYWRVKGIDDNLGESPFAVGSFVYKTTVVRFTSDQPDTKVYVDGNYGYPGRLLGTAGPGAPLDVQNISLGSHFVTFVKAGYEPYYTLSERVEEPLSEKAHTVIVDASLIKASRINPATGVDLFNISVGHSSPFVVDYNNDGIKDIIAGGADGNVYLYLGQVQEGGTVVYVPQGAVPNINVDARAVPFVVDYNNDNRKDLLVGSGEGFIYLYLNNGTDDIPEFAPAVTVVDAAANSAPSILDYNNDGKKDMVAGSYDGTLRIYINTGTDESPVFSAPAAIKADNADLNVGSNSKAFFTDWNSDGKKDIVAGSAGAVNLFLNIGSDESPVFVSINGLQQWIREKKRERGNREFVPYLGYNHDLGNLAGDSGEASIFVAEMGGSPSTARDLVVGNGTGNITIYITGQ